MGKRAFVSGTVACLLQVGNGWEHGVIARLQIFIGQPPSAVAREEAEKVLAKLEAFGG